jgi:NAD(P)-dependent dehydrogenase (short-subunit alcohol dehydrogenase family)
MAGGESVAELRPGLRVMISGAAAGIGRVMLERFVEARARVHICNTSPQVLDQCREALPGVGGTVADVGQDGEVARWFDEAQAVLGGLDVLINNAGIAGPTGPVEELAPADWLRTMDVNINGMFYCTRRAVPLLKRAAAEHGGAVIVNLSSAAGRVGYPLRTPYAASKWAVVGFTKSLSMELGPLGIRVNAILPGPVAGPRIERVIAAKAQAMGKSHEEVRDLYTQHASLRRFVTAEDVANMALFLCTEQARNISGQALAVDGDLQRAP